jgi:hypothetical protein
VHVIPAVFETADAVIGREIAGSTPAVPTTFQIVSDTYYGYEKAQTNSTSDCR